MITVTRKFEWDAAHRILRHESKCKFLHGHRYAAEVTVQAPELDSLGRVIDFGVMKEAIGLWIDKNWDHNILLCWDDPLCRLYENTEEGPTYFLGRAPYFFPSEENPTAENIATELFFQCSPLLPPDIKIAHVRIWETPSCYADFFPESSPLPTRY